MMRMVSACAALLALAACDEGPSSVGEMQLTDGGEVLTVHRERVVLAALGDGVQIEWNADNDPLCDAADDELTYLLTLVAPDIAEVPLGVDLDITAPDTPVTASLSSICFCATPTSDNAELTGTVRFEALSGGEVQATVDLMFEGDLAHGNDRSISLQGSFEGPGDQGGGCG